MKDSVLLTVLCGVLVFVFSQFIVKLTLEPLVEFRKQLGMLSAHLLKELNVIVHGDADEAVIEELRRLNSSVFASSYAVPLYSFFAYVFKLPSRTTLVEATRSVNVIIADLTYRTENIGTREDKAKRYERLQSIEARLKIKVTYGYDASKL